MQTQSSELSPLHCNQPSRWLITGGAGFIGCNLIKSLISKGACHIRVLDNLSVGTREDLARVCTFTELDPVSLSPQHSALSPVNDHVPTIELVTGDIRDPQACEKATKNTDVIVHLAANTGVAPSVDNPRLDMEANVIGTLNMLEAARQNKVKRFIFASSGAPVGECDPPIHEELAAHPVSPYGASKLAGEGYCSAYYRTFGLETICLRFGNVYGPLSSHKSSVVAKFIRQALTGEVCEIYGDGTQTRDFIYIDDLVAAIIKAANVSSLSPQHSILSPKEEDSVLSTQHSALKFPWGEPFQIATNKEHTVNEVAELLKQALFEKANVGMQIAYGAQRLGDVSRNYSDTTKARNLLNWTAETNLERGLKNTIEWFLNSSALAPHVPYSIAAHRRL